MVGENNFGHDALPVMLTEILSNDRLKSSETSFVWIFILQGYTMLQSS